MRHDAVLEAVAFAAERLLLAADWREAADEVLERMGRAAGASRAFVIENRTDETGRAARHDAPRVVRARVSLPRAATPPSRRLPGTAGSRGGRRSSREESPS